MSLPTTAHDRVIPSLSLALLFLLRVPLAAHGDIASQVRDVSERIRQHPQDASLYLKRGELYRVLRQWDAATADYDRASQLNPSLAAVDLARGRSLHEAGHPQAALAAIDRFLARNPRHGEGRILRARLLVSVGRHGEAADEYSRGLAAVSRPQPEHYLERAQALVKSGRAGDALRGLDEGLSRLPDCVTLQLAAIDLEVHQKRYDSALARLEKVAALSARKDPWLARRAEILERAGRRAEAHAAYKAALSALESLPPSRRAAPATREAEKRLRAELQRLSAALKYGDIT